VCGDVGVGGGDVGGVLSSNSCIKKIIYCK
jgi:hypothetical protein